MFLMKISVTVYDTRYITIFIFNQAWPTGKISRMIKIPMKTQRHLTTEKKIEIHKKVRAFFTLVLNSFLSAYTCARISNQKIRIKNKIKTNKTH